MSHIGKIFILLNLVLAAAFVGWGATTLNHVQDYKKQLADLEKSNKDALAAKDGELSKLNINLNDVTEQQRRIREEKDVHETEANRLKTQLEELKRSNTSLQASLTGIESKLGEYKGSIDQLSQQKDQAVERAHEAERARDSAVQEKDAAVTAQADAEEASKNAQREIQDLKAQNGDLQEQVSKLDARIAQIVAQTGVDLSKVSPAPKIDAFVLSIDRGLKLVVLNKGKKDNVKEGYTFDVYRGSQYKGRVRIQDVQESMSSGLIETEKTAIASGDSATTIL